MVLDYGFNLLDLTFKFDKMKFKCYLDGKECVDQDLIQALNQNEIPIFESLRIYGGFIFREAEHLSRLIDSARSCGIVLPALSVLRLALSQAMQSNGAVDGFIRITFHADKIFVMIGERKHNPAIYETGVDLKTSSFRMPSSRETTVQAKTGNYRLQLLAAEPRAKDQEPSLPFEYLFLDENHFLTESRVGNFFMVKKGVVLTPPATQVLNGITREVVIECARELGFSVHETPLTRHEAFNADEAFLTNTSWEILPVRSLDGRTVRVPIPGPITQKLIACFHRKVKRECHLQKKVPPVRKSAARLSPSRTKKA